MALKSKLLKSSSLADDLMKKTTDATNMLDSALQEAGLKTLVTRGGTIETIFVMGQGGPAQLNIVGHIDDVTVTMTTMEGKGEEEDTQELVELVGDILTSCGYGEPEEFKGLGVLCFKKRGSMKKADMDDDAADLVDYFKSQGFQVFLDAGAGSSRYVVIEKFPEGSGVPLRQPYIAAEFCKVHSTAGARSYQASVRHDNPLRDDVGDWLVAQGYRMFATAPEDEAVADFYMKAAND